MLVRIDKKIYQQLTIFLAKKCSKTDPCGKWNACCLCHSCVLMHPVEYQRGISCNTLSPCSSSFYQWQKDLRRFLWPTMTPPVLKETAPTEEYDLSPRNTKKIISRSLLEKQPSAHTPPTHSVSEMSFEVKGAQKFRNKLVMCYLQGLLITFLHLHSIWSLLPWGGIGSGKYCCIFKALWAQVLCWFSRGILDCGWFHPSTGH